MLKLLATILRRKPGGTPGPEGSGDGDPLADDSAPIFEELAMTEELRDALFPKTPQMISAVFDRPAPLDRGSVPAPARLQAPGGGHFPIIF
jgi:hypothetical protein